MIPTCVGHTVLSRALYCCVGAGSTIGGGLAGGKISEKLKVKSEKLRKPPAADAVLRWIPAFAGMTYPISCDRPWVGWVSVLTCWGCCDTIAGRCVVGV